MTLTFTSDHANGWNGDEHQAASLDNGKLFDGLPGGEAATVVGEAGRPTSVFGRLRRFASKLPAYLSERRRLPPEGDYLRRDIGLSEREVPQEYWQFYFWDR